MVRKMMLGIHERISPTTANKTPVSSATKNVLCYGDSLTAGMSSVFQMSPYAPHLEKALNNGTVVRHRGNPGWTAAAMVNSADNPRAGLRSAIQAQKPDLVIIMAGTNDLGRYSRGTIEQRAAVVVAPIKKLHQIAWEAGVPHTIAIAVPPSGFQASVAEAANLAKLVNQQLEAFCKASNGRGVFVEFPFAYERNGKYWSSDTLHFSPAGYKFLGESLAAPVQRVLASQPAAAPAATPAVAGPANRPEEKTAAPTAPENTSRSTVTTRVNSGSTPLPNNKSNGTTPAPNAATSSPRTKALSAPKAAPKATNAATTTATTKGKFTYWPAKQQQKQAA